VLIKATDGRVIQKAQFTSLVGMFKLNGSRIHKRERSWFSTPVVWPLSSSLPNRQT